MKLTVSMIFSLKVSYFMIYTYIYVHIYTYKFKQRLDRVISAKLFQPSVTCHIETT